MLYQKSRPSKFRLAIAYRMYYNVEFIDLTFFEAMEVSPRIIVQGGAYRRMPPDKKEDYMRATKESAQAGYRVLMVGFQ